MPCLICPIYVGRNKVVKKMAKPRIGMVSFVNLYAYNSVKLIERVAEAIIKNLKEGEMLIRNEKPGSMKCTPLKTIPWCMPLKTCKYALQSNPFPRNPANNINIITKMIYILRFVFLLTFMAKRPKELKIPNKIIYIVTIKNFFNLLIINTYLNLNQISTLKLVRYPEYRQMNI